MKIISINDAHHKLVNAVKEAGGLTKFCRKHNLSHDHRSGLKKCVDGKIKPFPMFLRCIGIHKVYVEQ